MNIQFKHINITTCSTIRKQEIKKFNKLTVQQQNIHTI